MVNAGETCLVISFQNCPWLLSLAYVRRQANPEAPCINPLIPSSSPKINFQLRHPTFPSKSTPSIVCSFISTYVFQMAITNDDAADCNQGEWARGTRGHEPQASGGQIKDCLSPGEKGSSRDKTAEMASWAGQPNVKGSTESMRMALLTFSLVGIQLVYLFNWGCADADCL